MLHSKMFSGKSTLSLCETTMARVDSIGVELLDILLC